MFYAILLFLIAYLIGSIPNALIIGKAFRGIDIREHGSGNLGSTNAVRVLGKKLGLTVFALDVLKGVIPTLTVMILNNNGFLFNINTTYTWFNEFIVFEPLYYGLFAIIGHIFPIFAKFKGGKAVATSLGIVLVLTPIPGILCLVTFYITLKVTGYVSLASTFAMATVCISSFIIDFIDKTKDYLIINILYIIVSLVMIWRHRKNYVRIFNGTENSFKKKKENISEEKKE